MRVNSIGGGANYAPPAGLGELQRQKEALSKQLEELKAKAKNNPAEQAAAEKQIKALERRIAEIERQMQAASQKKTGEAETKEETQAAKPPESISESELDVYA